MDVCTSICFSLEYMLALLLVVTHQMKQSSRQERNASLLEYYLQVKRHTDMCQVNADYLTHVSSKGFEELLC
jgi:hypothetical protein